MIRLACAVLLFAATGAKATDWNVDPSSTLAFSGTYQGEKFSGRFSKFTAEIRLDPADLTTSKLDVNIDVTSISTGNADYDGELKKPEFFDFLKFPKSRFVSSSVQESGGGLIASGTLTIRDKSRPVELKLGFTKIADGATLDVETTLKRLDFDIGTGDWADTSAIGNDIPVTAHLILKPNG